MKKALILILAALMCLSVIACGKKTEPEATASAETAAELTTDGETTAVEIVTLPKAEYVTAFNSKIKDGVRIVFDGGYTFFAMGNTVWYESRESTYANRIADGAVNVYVFEDGEWWYDDTVAIGSTGYSPAAETMMSLIFPSDYKDLVKVGEEAVNGRACTVCRGTVNNNEYKFWIDNQSGITLQCYDVTGNILSYMVIAISYGDINEPKLPNPDGEENIWEENRFTAVLPKPEFGILTSADISDDGHTFSVFVNVANEANVNAYIQTLLDAGFTGEKTLENEGMDIRFRGDTVAGYTVEVFYTNGTVTIALADIIE